VRIGTRGSALALAQAEWVASQLGDAQIVTAEADGAKGDKSRFTRGVEQLLLDGKADLGVHSTKDLPTEMDGDLALAGVPAREEPADAWIGAGGSLAAVEEGARVGTASLRRRSQLLAARPDLHIVELHGNVDTRLRKLEEGELDAIVLAAAGLRRLGLDDRISFPLDTEEMTPAAGQGALALQARRADGDVQGAAAALSDETALIEVAAERTVVAALDADCSSPLGVHARREGEALALSAYVGLPDGSEWLRDRIDGDAESPAEAGSELAGRLLSAGAAELLDRARETA